MFNKVLTGVVVPIFEFCVDLFFSVFNSLGATGFVFGAFIIITISRFLLSPLIKGALISKGEKLGSDIRSARDSNNQSSSDSRV